MRSWLVPPTLALASLLALAGCKSDSAAPDVMAADASVDETPVEGPVTKKDVGGSCEVDTDCLGNICYAKTCRKACADPSSCASGEDCGSDGAPHPAFCYQKAYAAEVGQSCAVTGTCPGGMKCMGGADSAESFCAAECTDATACPPTMYCRQFDDASAPGGKRSYCWAREFCSRCLYDAQCPGGGKCVKQGTDSFCTLPCHQGSTECPRIADCKDVGGGDFQCLHRSGSCVGDGSMCAPCNEETDCKDAALCLHFIFSGEGFCATSCPTKGAQCENSAGYQCQSVALTATTSSNQCVPYDKDPTKEISCNPLSATMEVGDIVPDFEMVGYADDNKDLSLKGESLRVVKLSEFTDAKIILFTVAAGWCNPCQQETKGMLQLMTDYRRDGLMIFQVLFDGANEGDDPTRSLLDSWVGAFNPQGACGIDPDRVVAPWNTDGSTPLNMILDAKTRKVLLKWNAISPPGYASVAAAVQKFLTP